MTESRLRIAVLWPGPTGYMYSCLSELERIADVFFAAPDPLTEWPFDESALPSIGQRYGWANGTRPAGLLEAVEQFRPDAVLASSWNVAEYRRVLHAFAGRAVRIMCMDNTWLGRPKQWLGRAAAPVYVRPMYECVFVAGERQARFARMLGFPDGQIIRGFLSADRSTFDRGEREVGEIAARRRFLFAGRLVRMKGIDLIAQAYESYRTSVEEPWALTVVGDGPDADLLNSVPGVDSRGFLQPEGLAEVMHTASSLLLPSRFEPWGVVVHEAAFAGLPMICSTAVGAADTFLQDGFNGWLIPADDADALTDAMFRVATAAAADLGRMSAGSHALSAQLTPERWASYLVEEVQRRNKGAQHATAPTASWRQRTRSASRAGLPRRSPSDDAT